MPLRDDLLNPIPGANPSGVDLRYDPVYDKIKEARREDDDAPQGAWTRTRKTADWALVIKLTTDALAAKSKDLQIAAWLTEAMLRREGFAGLRASLGLLQGLIETFWDTLYPEIDDGDAEIRAAPLDWIGLKLDIAVRQAPLTRTGLGLLSHEQAQKVPSETVAEAEGRGDERATAIAEGKLTPEEWDRAFAETPKAWYRALLADIDGTLEAIDALDAAGRERFQDVAPGYGRLREALEEVQRLAGQLLKQKLEIDPDPVEAPPPGEAEASFATGGGASSGAPNASGAISAEPISREDAALRVAAAARFLRRADPTNPASYLLLRGFRWGELRAQGGDVDPRLLEAPPTQTRTQLKGLMLDRKWADLLELAEMVMSTPYGRGWFDLQRYTLAACEGLGGEYGHVASAVMGALRGLLTDMPQLLEMTLMDDTPTANVATRAWLRDAVMLAPDASDQASEGARAPRASRSSMRMSAFGSATAMDPYARAMAETRAGRPQRGIEILSREVSREKSHRGRFIRQTQLAEMMVDNGLEAVARPILEELLALIDSKALDSWEAAETVAQPMELLYRCLARLDDASGTREALYLRLCKLDPMAAMRLTPASA